MTRLLHISDTHGLPPPIRNVDADIIVATGDLLENASRGNVQTERFFQPRYFRAHQDAWKKAINGRQILVVSGNHCFISVADVMRECGIHAVGCDDRLVRTHGLNFYGFPWVNAFTREWSHELEVGDMVDKFAPVVDMMNRREIDVMLAHSPLYGLLDQNGHGERCGSTVMRDCLDYEVEDAGLPIAYLHGHIHEAAWRDDGFARYRGMLVSNAATTFRVIEVNGGKAEVVG